MFKLIAQNGAEYPIEGSGATIGRESCDILLLQDDMVSRQHARVALYGDALTLTDMGSANGTLVNGVRLQGPRALQPGDVIQIGSTRLTVYASGRAQPTRLISEPPAWPAPAVPPVPVAAPVYQPAPAAAPVPMPAPVYSPAPPYPPYAAQGQPYKDKSIAYILEFILLGLGWIYAGNTSAGIIILISWLVVGLGVGITVDVITGGFGCLCTGPLMIVAYVFSLIQLGSYMRDRPHIFR